MVFYYKIITDANMRRSNCSSPRKASPVRRLPDLPGPVSQMVHTLKTNEFGNDLLDDVPEREWRLLSALARKRDQSAEREKLAEEFRNLWQKEKMERNYISAQISEQYKNYLNRKRDDYNILRELRSYHLKNRQEQKQEYLMDSIRYKDQRSADLQAYFQDRKASRQLDKILEEESRAILAADRRSRLGAAEKWRKRLEMMDELRRIDVARNRKSEHLKTQTQRLAINNALHSWESELLRQESCAVDELRRAHHAAHAELTMMRSARIARAREERLQRAKQVATFTAELRDAVRAGRG